MDDSIRSALEKYKEKNGIESSPANVKDNRIMTFLCIIVTVVLGFSLCVKYDVLGADKVWERISKINIGEKTVGSLFEGIESGIVDVFSKNDIDDKSPNENE